MTDERNSGFTGKLLTQILLWSVITAALLFVPAGTLHWPSAWAYLALWLMTGTWSGLVLAKENPDILRERMRPLRQQAQKGWDRPVLVAILAGLGCIARRRRARLSIRPVVRSALAVHRRRRRIRARDVCLPHRDAGKFLCVAGRQSRYGARAQSDLDRSLRMGAPSHVQRRHSLFYRSAAAARLLVRARCRHSADRHTGAARRLGRTDAHGRACRATPTTPSA